MKNLPLRCCVKKRLTRLIWKPLIRKRTNRSILRSVGRVGSGTSTYNPQAEKKVGNDIEKLFGIEAEALTASEAAYILNFRDVDALRNRGAKAGHERSTRPGTRDLSRRSYSLETLVDADVLTSLLPDLRNRLDSLQLKQVTLEVDPDIDAQVALEICGVCSS